MRPPRLGWIAWSLFGVLGVLAVAALVIVFGFSLAGKVPSSAVLWFVCAGVLLALAIVLYLEWQLRETRELRSPTPE